MNTTCPLVMLALIAWLRILIVRFLCRNGFPLPHSVLWKQVTKSGPHLRNRVSFTFLEGKHLHILFRIFLKGRLVSSVIFIYLYNHLFVLLWIMYIYCILRIIIHYRHTSFGCPFLCCTLQILNFSRIVLWQPRVRQVCLCQFHRSVYAFGASVSHFDSSRNI